VRDSRTGIALLLVAVALAGCGSGGDKQAELSSGQAQALIAQLEAARASAAARDQAGTRANLTKFRRSVARLQREGALSAQTTRALRIGAARVLKRVESDSAPPPQPATAVTQTTPVPAPQPPGQAKKDEKKHDKGKDEKHGKEGDE
jgi:hypothetical protein